MCIKATLSLYLASSLPDSCDDSIVLRLAYLADSIALNENSARELQDLLNQHAAAHSICFMFYESSTSQTFVVNRCLATSLTSDEYNTIFIESSTGESVELDVETASAAAQVIQALREHAKGDASTALVFDVTELTEFSRLSEETGEQGLRIRHFMIALTGVLLEYPFTYYISPRSGTMNHKRHVISQMLVFVELQLASERDDIDTIIKFSVPQAFKINREDTFVKALVTSKSLYQARLANFDDTASRNHLLAWRVTENVSGADIAL